MLDYRDLAALPRDKAIYNIDRPDMISYSPYISRVAADRQSYGEVGPAGGLGQPVGWAVTPTPVSWEVTRRSPRTAWRRPCVWQSRKHAGV